MIDDGAIRERQTRAAPAARPGAGRGSAVGLALSAAAVVALASGASIIGGARAFYPRHYYISELGAVGMPTAAVFQVGFLLVVAGIALVAVVVRDVRSRASVRVLRQWTPAVSLLVAAALFSVAAAVPCSYGCPSLLWPQAQARDWLHISVAVLAFAAGCWAMLQFATATDRWIARLSIVGGIAVAAIATTGGLLSLLDGDTRLGSALEFVAAGIGVLWLALIAVVHALPRRSRQSQGSD